MSAPCLYHPRLLGGGTSKARTCNIFLFSFFLLPFVIFLLLGGVMSDPRSQIPGGHSTGPLGTPCPGRTRQTSQWGTRLVPGPGPARPIMKRMALRALLAMAIAQGRVHVPPEERPQNGKIKRGIMGVTRRSIQAKHKRAGLMPVTGDINIDVAQGPEEAVAWAQFLDGMVMEDASRRSGHPGAPRSHGGKPQGASTLMLWH